jgi:hypothetical protein
VEAGYAGCRDAGSDRVVRVVNAPVAGSSLLGSPCVAPFDALASWRVRVGWNKFQSTGLGGERDDKPEAGLQAVFFLDP